MASQVIYNPRKKWWHDTVISFKSFTEKINEALLKKSEVTLDDSEQIMKKHSF